ncbi:transglutaminase TgpA family protein [Paenibacillus caseinilyticus]|uniref:transglutaminase TgpA family protein n=1 Tax=Paenibacillus caseinilyticus TaxID=3098138 RepID=UPI0022B93607|nr:transglutaminase domain-containing protein [Paenibacillus caseinilyticus]MCZ8518660.1 cysteine protease [Paenibacillus caseinilyticus]
MRTPSTRSAMRRFFWDDWPHRLTLVLSGLILLQFTLWFGKEEGLWLPETVRIAQLTLLIVCVLEHLQRMHWLVRGLLQFLLILGVNVTVLESSGIVETMPVTSFLSSRLFLNLYELTPYLWFALGSWAAYHFMIWWVEAKWRIYLLLVASVTLLCIRDSFSAVYLWPQVAVIVGCGLFLLILCHFSQLRRRDPAAWRHLADYPSSIALPVVGLVSLTVLIGAMMPEVGPSLTDPYTAWRSLRGEPMNFTTDKGVTVPPTEAMDSSSGYSRSDAALGGGFQFDYTPVMEIETSQRSYWRGETRSLYTGRGWDESESERRNARSPVRVDNVLASDPRLPSGNMKTVEVTQQVTLLTEQRYPVLFGAYSIQKVTGVNNLKNGFEPLQWSAAQGELRFSERQPYPKTYQIVSQVPVVDEAALRQLPAGTPPGADEFLALPANLPERVKRLAADITAGASNPYDKAKKIEQYLQTTFPYTNKPDLSKARSRDFVDRFLFEIKEGYCDYYSSAMAVMARSVGLPARWVKGYSSGSTPLDQAEIMGLIPGQAMMDADAAGTYTVRNADAHSWVEVYFSGYGWVPFEPTAGFSMPRATLPDVPAVQPAEAPEPEASAPEPAADEEQGHGLVIAAGVTVLAALAVLLAWKLQVVELWRERARRRRASLLKQKIIVECERMLRIFRRSGYVREEHETLREAVARWTKQSRWMRVDAETVLGLFEKAKYGKAEITEDDYKTATMLIDKLRSQL